MHARTHARTHACTLSLQATLPRSGAAGMQAAPLMQAASLQALRPMLTEQCQRLLPLSPLNSGR
eukprot:6382097-Alexandrium_andersonii.AAC.1